jgi:hypothetical protein
MEFPRQSLKPDSRKQIPLSITIGIDFGASYSKVCFNENKQVNTILFDSSEYRPSILYYNHKIKVIYYINSGNESNIEQIKYFKYSMVDDSLPKSKYLVDEQIYTSAETLCSIFYIACLIKESKAYIIQSYKERNINLVPDWSITMGVPIVNYENKNKSLYDKIFHIAIKLSDTLLDDSIGLWELNNFYQENVDINIPRFQESPFNTLPELYAECLSFLQDRNVPLGVYAVVDIGGATVDMAVIYKESANKFSIVSKDIQPLGIEIVISNIIRQNTPRESVEECLHKHIINPDYIDTTAEHCYFERLRMMFAQLAIEIKSKYSARDALIKQKGILKIILCGGGGNYKWYENCILSNKENLFRALDIGYHLEIIPLRKLLDASGINNHRLLIAKGLAQRVEDIPVIENFPWHFQQIEWNTQSFKKNKSLDDISIEKYGELN